MDNLNLRGGGHHRRGGVLYLLSACVRVPGQVAGALCSGKERRRLHRQYERRARGRAKQDSSLALEQSEEDGAQVHPGVLLRFPSDFSHGLTSSRDVGRLWSLPAG